MLDIGRCCDGISGCSGVVMSVFCSIHSNNPPVMIPAAHVDADLSVN